MLRFIIRLFLILTLSSTVVRHGHTATIVLHAESSAPTALHLEVLSHDAVTPLSVAIDHGVCLANGCNAVGTSATMTETVAIASSVAITLTGYVSAGDGAAQTQAIPLPASYVVYIP